MNQQTASSASLNALPTRHGPLALPAFLPDATRAVVRALDTADVAACGIRALMVNVLHLSSHPGTGAIEALGGIHRFMGCTLPIASDSGGFQAFSLASEGRSLGSVSDRGFVYRIGPLRQKKLLTPEKCIQRQFQLGADIMFCLDYCTHPAADAATQRESVAYTVKWAAQCKAEFERRAVAIEDGQRPLLFAVVQGGDSRELRRECASRLLEIGFDGYGFGGWPIAETGRLVDMTAYVSEELIPPECPKHALGIGKPDNVVRAYRSGYRLFDCALPTRDARHKRLFIFAGSPPSLVSPDTFSRCVYLQDAAHFRDPRPVEEGCDCLCCRNYSRAYLHHLFTINETAALRLATLHNLRFYARLMDMLAAGA